MGGRYYGASVGRFTQRDPEPGSAYEPLSYNRYVYVVANPVNYTDEDGFYRHYYTYSRHRTHYQPWCLGVLWPPLASDLLGTA